MRSKATAFVIVVVGVVFVPVWDVIWCSISLGGSNFIQEVKLNKPHLEHFPLSWFGLSGANELQLQKLFEEKYLIFLICFITPWSEEAAFAAIPFHSMLLFLSCWISYVDFIFVIRFYNQNLLIYSESRTKLKFHNENAVWSCARGLSCLLKWSVQMWNKIGAQMQ